ncbi:Spy/CpxP family protein refolding chaperone [Maridesulfovibrio sp.]|uniref:Spy/CpxP family protein refolding chaperone n=1 Tax=Maridesulfovibrio sp. TaxID=2795000 RepID=UPI0029F598B9|nr:Spy/CpxP family protein refolding chaperone [Maridesulfovibrio sp.]
MRKILIIAVLSSVVMLGACTKFAAMKGPFDGNEVNIAFVEYLVEKTDDRLDLTSDQRDHFKAIVESMAAKALAQRPETEGLRKRMADTVRKPQFDMEKMEELIKERMQLFHNIFEEEKADFAAFHASLTAKQREALAQLILDHGKKGWHGGY